MAYVTFKLGYGEDEYEIGRFDTDEKAIEYAKEEKGRIAYSTDNNLLFDNSGINYIAIIDSYYTIYPDIY